MDRVERFLFLLGLQQAVAVRALILATCWTMMRLVSTVVMMSQDWRGLFAILTLCGGRRGRKVVQKSGAVFGVTIGLRCPVPRGLSEILPWWSIFFGPDDERDVVNVLSMCFH